MIFIIFFVIVFAIIGGLYIRRREIVFEGEVVDKDIHESTVQNNSMGSGGITFGNSGGVTHSYMIKVKTDAGKEVNYQISEGKYEIIKIGDRVSKPKGTTDITILSSRQSVPDQNSPAQSDPQPPHTFV
jgi:hypothetical protein